MKTIGKGRPPRRKAHSRSKTIGTGKTPAPFPSLSAERGQREGRRSVEIGSNSREIAGDRRENPGDSRQFPGDTGKSREISGDRGSKKEEKRGIYKNYKKQNKKCTGFSLCRAGWYCGKEIASPDCCRDRKDEAIVILKSNNLFMMSNVNSTVPHGSCKSFTITCSEPAKPFTKPAQNQHRLAQTLQKRDSN